MPIDKVLSVSIANAAINASAISNTANLVIGALNTGNTVVTGTQFVNGAVTFANSTANNFYVFSNGEVSIGSSNTNAEAPLYIRTDTKSHNLHLFNSNSYTQIIYQANAYRYQTGVGFNGETQWGVANSFFIFDAGATTMRFVMSANGNIGIGNNVTRQAKLNFENVIGNKIDFYHTTSGSGDRYGIQVQSNELRIHSGSGGDANGGITLGKSTTSTFTEYARLTNSGYLRVYNQPSFAVYGTSTNFAVDTNTYDVPFNTATFNVGSFFNTSTYTFTAPVAGKYYVSFAFLIYPNSIPSTHYITGWISKNGSSYLNSLPMGRMSFKENQTTMGADGIVDLAAGDTIKVQVQGSTSGLSIYVNTGHAHFSGYLLG